VTGPYAAAARGYLEGGYSPIPLPAGRKKPPPDGWTGADGAMASAADVEEWCHSDGGGNVALRLPPGVIGVDADAYKGPAEAAAWAQLCAKLGPLPGDAPWCTSRDDGVSGIRLFQVPGGYTAAGSLPGEPSPGETVKHAYRYVVAPPSVVAPPRGNGQPYRWAVPLRPVRELPWLPLAWQDALRDRTGREHGSGSTWTSPDPDALVTDGIPGGVTQDYYLRDLVFELARKGFDRASTRVVWKATVALTPLEDPDWPWAEADFKRHWDGAGRKLQAAGSNTSNSGQEAAVRISGPLTSDYDTSNTSNSVQCVIRDGAWLDSQQFPPLAYAIPGLMPAGFGVIAAPPKAGKSLLILDWLLAAALGGQALGAIRTGPARDVLYLALEDGDRRLQDRCRNLLADGEPIPERLRYILTVPPGQVLAVLGDALDRYPDTRLVVLDTLGRIMPDAHQGETTYQRDYRVGTALKKIADTRPGLAIIVIHHTRKAVADDFVDAISGTHGLAGAADTIITLARRRGDGDGTLRVTGRDVMEASYALKFSQGAWSLDGATLAEARANVARRAEAGSLGGRSAEIIEFARQHPGGVTNAQVREKFGDGADTYLKRLHETGRLTKPKRGLYLVSEVSELSESQVSGPGNSNNSLRDVSEVSETPPPLTLLTDSRESGTDPRGWPEGSIGQAETEDPDDYAF
jgi:hypothetical protein